MRTLPARVGVIAGRGGEPALALAGVMGGASSEIGDETRVVALEAAWWEPLAVRRGARALAMHTEASHRMERGIDIGAGPDSLARVAHLLQKIGGGSVRPGIVERTGNGRPSRSLRLRPARVSALLGTDVPTPRQVAILGSLGFGVDEQAGEIAVRVPSWRMDVSGEADLAEEVGRQHGIQRIPTALPAASRPGSLRRSQRRERRIREVLTGVGLTEVINYAFVAGAQVDAPEHARLRLANPLTEEQDTLRGSLVMPGLVNTLRTNLRLGRRDVAIFELGRVFFPGQPMPREQRRLAVLLSGVTHPQHWSLPSRPFDLFDLKGFVELLFERLGQSAPAVDGGGGAPAFLHPGRAVGLSRGGEPIGYAGALHPDVRARWELRDEAVVLEIALDAVLEELPRAVRFTALDRFPAVQRDLSIMCDETTPAAAIDARVRAAAGERLRSVSLARPLHGEPGAARQGQPHGEPALPGPGAHPDERRGAGLGRRRRARAALRRLRDSWRAGAERRRDEAERPSARGKLLREEAAMDEHFDLLEQRVQKAAARLRELKGENATLRAEVHSATTRAEKAERAARAAALSPPARTSSPARWRRSRELSSERDEIRARVGKLLELLERLE